MCLPVEWLTIKYLLFGLVARCTLFTCHEAKKITCHNLLKVENGFVEFGKDSNEHLQNYWKDARDCMHCLWNLVENNLDSMGLIWFVIFYLLLI